MAANLHISSRQIPHKYKPARISQNGANTSIVWQWFINNNKNCWKPAIYSLIESSLARFWLLSSIKRTEACPQGIGPEGRLRPPSRIFSKKGDVTPGGNRYPTSQTPPGPPPPTAKALYVGCTEKTVPRCQISINMNMIYDWQYLVSEWLSEWVSEWVSEWASEWVGESVSQSVCEARMERGPRVHCFCVCVCVCVFNVYLLQV